ncbi:unnamed protein product, partial [marine sediment metagenome]
EISHVAEMNPRLDIDILGASSDHLIMDAKETNLEPGDQVILDVDYGAMLAAMTSPYVGDKSGDSST